MDINAPALGAIVASVLSFINTFLKYAKEHHDERTE